jgi:DHA1 family tetracycline resistance protein-like MFS transporter
LSNTIVGFLAAPLVGDLSDSHGRVPFAALGMALGLLPAGVVALYLRFPLLVPLWWYYPASVLGGAVQASTIFLAYASDVMPPQHRVGSFAAIIAAFSLGFVVGPGLGASLNPADAAAATFVVASACAALTLLAVPESRSAEQRRSGPGGEQRRAAPRPLDALLSLRRSCALLGSRDLFVRLALVMAVASVVGESVQDLLVQYLQLVAGFTTKDQGTLFVVIGLCNLLVQGVLLPPLARRLGEVALLRWGLVLSAAEHVMLSMVRSRGQALAAVALGSFAGVAWPAISAIKSNNCGADEQGLVQGALASLRALATGIGPLFFAALYRNVATAEAPLGFHPGLVFWAAAVLTLAAVCVAFTLPADAGRGGGGGGGGVVVGVAGGGGGTEAAVVAGAAAAGGSGQGGGRPAKYAAVPGNESQADDDDDLAAQRDDAGGGGGRARRTTTADEEQAGGGGGGGGADGGRRVALIS